MNERKSGDRNEPEAQADIPDYTTNDASCQEPVPPAVSSHRERPIDGAPEDGAGSDGGDDGPPALTTEDVLGWCGDPVAQRALVRYCGRAGAVAEDLAQETRLRLVRQVGRARPENLHAYATGIAGHVVARELARRYRAQPRRRTMESGVTRVSEAEVGTSQKESVPPAPGDDRQDIDDYWATRMLVMAVVREMQRDATYYDVLRRHLEGEEDADIANTLQTSAGAIRQRIHKRRLRLRALFGAQLRDLRGDPGGDAEG